MIEELNLTYRTPEAGESGNGRFGVARIVSMREVSVMFDQLLVSLERYLDVQSSLVKKVTVLVAELGKSGDGRFGVAQTVSMREASVMLGRFLVLLERYLAVQASLVKKVMALQGLLLAPMESGDAGSGWSQVDQGCAPRLSLLDGEQV